MICKPCKNTAYGLTADAFFSAGYGCQLCQQLLGSLRPIRGDAVVHPCAFLATGYDSGIAQNLHVVGQSGLTDAHLLQQTAGAFLTAAKQLQNLQPVFITEGLKHSGGFSVF